MVQFPVSSITTITCLLCIIACQVSISLSETIQEVPYISSNELNNTFRNDYVPLHDGIDDDGMMRKIIKYKNFDGRRSAMALAKKFFHEFIDDKYLVVSVNDMEDLATLEADDNIESIEDDGYWTEQGILDQVIDPEDLEGFFYTNSSTFHRHLAAEQIPYGISMVQAPAVPVGKSRIQVCMVDTGIAYGHPDFNKLNVRGASRTSSSDHALLMWNRDMRGHGTHTAGTVAAKSYNNYAVRGMGNIPLYITRGLSDTGGARESDVIQAMQQCVKAGSKVISLSLSGGSMSSAFKAQIDRFYGANIMIVAAAGNDGKRIATYPSAYNKVVSVGAVDKNGNRWSGSNYGPWLELAAPGVGVVSLGATSGGAYTVAIYTGTSMATPHVAGAAALLWSHYPTCSVTQIRYAMAFTALDKGPGGCDEAYGYGIVQVKKAWNFLRQFPCRNAAWGKNVGDGTCSAIDRRPARVRKNRNQ